MPWKILVVDDEEAVRLSLSEELREEGYMVSTATTGEEAVRTMKTSSPDLLLLDIKLPKMSGLDVLKKVKRLRQDILVIMLTAHGSFETAVEAGKHGVYNYIEKPFDIKKLKLDIKRALENLKASRENVELKEEITILKDRERQDLAANFVMGPNKKMKNIFEIMKKVAESNATTVFVQGESGTGKELIAKEIHYLSARRDKLFVEVNCTALPETLLESELFGHEKGAFTDAKKQKKGLFEAADKGTLFLDEIGDMSPSMQAKLLRALQEKCFQRVGGTKKISVDTRIIASTNKDLQKAMKEGQFREDLYYRLQVIPITLPPLRERTDDIMVLAEHFVKKFNAEFKKSVAKVSPQAKKRMMEYSWPGNIRELQNVIERAILLESHDSLLPEHLMLPEEDRTKIRSSAKELKLDAMEKKLIKKALDETGWDRNKAAKQLGVNRSTLSSKMRKYRIKERK